MELKVSDINPFHIKETVMPLSKNTTHEQTTPELSADAINGIAFDTGAGVALAISGIAGRISNSLPSLGTSNMMGYMGSFFSFPKKPDSELNRAIQLIKRMKECNELVSQHEDDIAKIREGLKQCNRDVLASNNDMKQELTQYSLVKYSIPSISKHAHFGRLENCIDMADTITQLLNQYPSLSMGTLDDLNASWNDWEEHHNKIISLVEDYLPETYACLKESTLKPCPERMVI